MDGTSLLTMINGHWCMNGRIDFNFPTSAGLVDVGGILKPGSDARTMKIDEFAICLAGASYDLEGHSKAKNEVGPSALIAILGVVQDQLRVFRPGVQVLELEFTRVSGARGALKLHRSVKYDLSGSRPRLVREDG